MSTQISSGYRELAPNEPGDVVSGVTDAKKIATGIINVVAVTALYFAGYHFFEWWGVLIVSALVLRQKL